MRPRTKNLILSRPAHADENCIRVRLDHRTIVLLKSMKHFDFWKQRYPGAHVIDAAGQRKQQIVDDKGGSEAPRSPPTHLT